MVCEISGEPLQGTVNEVVVTPSGHICIKRLLLTKLSENGGLDPFESKLPLSEDQLVTLQTPGSGGSMAPPRPQATSLPNLLGLLQKEYDAMVLELFDTRKTLEETRRELSQALYQNDAAIRVVARVSQERDAVKQQLEQWNASAASTAGGNTNGTTNVAEEEEPTAAAPPTEEEPTSTAPPPPAKRRRLEANAEVLKNDVPDDDIKAMNDIWTQLNKERKTMLKAAAAEAPTVESLAKYEFIEKKSWHKSSNRGISSMSATEDSKLIVTAGKDKQLVVYNQSDQVVQHTFGFGCIATCADIGNAMVVAGNQKGKIAVYSLTGDNDNNGNAGEINVGSKVVDVRAHPSDQHVIAATADGRVIIATWIAEEQRLQQVSSFEISNDGDDKKKKEEYTAGALHPDGFLYIAGTKTGRLYAWDFKNKALALTMALPVSGHQNNKTYKIDRPNQ
ncbi:MAG: pre-mRNA-processing factor 19 [Bacillariaceae sp.]|jgi:pre-mRNA-processing factor 19